MSKITMQIGRTPVRTLGIIIFSAAVAMPAFAQDSEFTGAGGRSGWESRPAPYHGRSCVQGPGFGQPCPGPLYGWSIGRDRSRVGGEAPSLRPSGS